MKKLFFDVLYFYHIGNVGIINAYTRCEKGAEQKKEKIL